MDEDFKVGSRVENVNKYGERETGVIKSVFEKIENGNREFYVNVLWDGMEEGDEEEYDLCDLEPEGVHAELEAEFRSVVDSHMKDIKEQLDIARAAIRKACEISEEHGIPFSASVSPLSQSYHPVSFQKFHKLDQETVSNITGAWTQYYNDGAGWEHSAVC
jgi:hypothetical protein